MKIQILNYSFDVANKTVTFSDYQQINLNGLLLITNVTTNQIVYNFANPALGGTVAGNILMLKTTLDGMSNGDSLQIFYENGVQLPTATESAQAQNDQTNWLLRRMVKLLDSLGVVDTKQRQRIAVETGVIDTVTSVSQIAGIDARYQFIEQARISYNIGIRHNLIFS